ncbi:hypothetical protein F5Y17DRAFT_393036 [Xylariaceae sp. FL0594]|nr:hypothetical protein F5Y17DRAFT_393036 [Xylariaceae sp. FL0594]
MASEPSNLRPGPAEAAATTDANTFTLQLKMPSDGVLVIEDLHFTTTIKELKARIRNASDKKPSDEVQRLIHRGRLLSRENETMLELFGEEALRSSERQTLHLAIRDHQTPHPSTGPATASPIPSTQAGIPPVPRPHGQLPLPVGAPSAQPTAIRDSTRRITQLHLQHANAMRQGVPPLSMRSQPGLPLQTVATRTITREIVGPNGQVWRVSFNESPVVASPGQPAPLFPRVPPPIWPPRPQSNTGSTGGDGSHSTQGTRPSARAGDIRRDAGSTSPVGAAAHSPNPSAATQNNSPSAAPPEVYILSSPSGPHAILINSDSNVYHSPQLERFSQTGLPQPPFSFNVTAREVPGAQYGMPQIIQRPTAFRGAVPSTPQGNTPPNQQAQVQPQQGFLPPQQLPHQFGHGMGNAQVHAIRIVQIWPHIRAHVWMAFRLALFIWWFTSPTSTWTRWLTVVSLAVAMFVANTGVLNPYVEQIWDPLHRFIVNLIPRVANHDQPQAAAGNGQDGDAAAPNRQAGAGANPDPAATAARLVQQRRRDNTGRLLNQIRRLERAGILFIASLAPGLAETHIAQVEAEIRAQRLQRQMEEEAAAAARAATEAGETTAAAAATTGLPEDSGNASAVGSAEATSTASKSNSPTSETGPEAPLVAAE